MACWGHQGSPHFSPPLLSKAAWDTEEGKPAPNRALGTKDTELLTHNGKAEMGMHTVLRSRAWMESFGISLWNTFLSKALFSKYTYMSQ